jgi:hypothetical protein
VRVIAEKVSTALLMEGETEAWVSNPRGLFSDAV